MPNDQRDREAGRFALIKRALDGYSARLLPPNARVDMVWLVEEVERLRGAFAALRAEADAEGYARGLEEAAVYRDAADEFAALLREWRETPFFERPDDWQRWVDSFGRRVDAMLALSGNGDREHERDGRQADGRGARAHRPSAPRRPLHRSAGVGDGECECGGDALARRVDGLEAALVDCISALSHLPAEVGPVRRRAGEAISKARAALAAPLGEAPTAPLAKSPVPAPAPEVRMPKLYAVTDAGEQTDADERAP